MKQMSVKQAHRGDEVLAGPHCVAGGGEVGAGGGGGGVGGVLGELEPERRSVVGKERGEGGKGGETGSQV